MTFVAVAPLVALPLLLLDLALLYTKPFLHCVERSLYANSRLKPFDSKALTLLVRLSVGNPYSHGMLAVVATPGCASQVGVMCNKHFSLLHLVKGIVYNHHPRFL